MRQKAMGQKSRETKGSLRCPYIIEWVVKTCCASMKWDCKNYIPSAFQIENYCLKDYEKCPLFRIAKERSGDRG